MKKNITINIFGTIYSIDEDAYQLLDSYLNGMQAYFRDKDGGDEISDDIEHRVAELLWEEKTKGMEAVNIETVRNIINTIGGAADIYTNSGSASDCSDSMHEEKEDINIDSAVSGSSPLDRMIENMRSKRLYRNPKNKMLGGVCSGLTEYLGGSDVTLFRLAIIVLFLVLLTTNIVAGFLPILYVILWLVVPEAKTHEDWLRMKGEEVNAENIRKQIITESENYEQEACGKGNNARSVGFLRVLATILLVIVLLPMIIGIFTIILSIVTLIVSEFGLIEYPWHNIEPSFNNPDIDSSIKQILWMGLVSAVLAFGLPIYAIARLIWHNGKPMAGTTKAFMIVIWILSLATMVAAIGMGVYKMGETFKDIHEKRLTRNGIRLASRYDWDMLDGEGWTILKMKNVVPNLVRKRSGFAGMPHIAFSIRRDTTNIPMTFKMEKQDYFEAGDYVVEILSEATGNKAKVIVEEIIDSVALGKKVKEPLHLASILLDRKGERLDTMSWNHGKNLPIFIAPDSADWESFAHDDEKWIYQISQPFHHNDGEMKVTIDIDNEQVNKVKIRHVQIRKL